MEPSHRPRLLFLLAGALAGCAPIPQRPFTTPSSPFDEAALRAGLEPGNATILGQAFSKTVGGEVRYGAGVPVYLLPFTTYVRECLSIAGYAPTDCGGKLAPFRRQTVGDGEGRFKFKNLKPGSYYVEATITWGVPSQIGVQTTGGTVKQIVEVPEGQGEVEVILN